MRTMFLAWAAAWTAVAFAQSTEVLDRLCAFPHLRSDRIKVLPVRKPESVPLPQASGKFSTLVLEALRGATLLGPAQEVISVLPVDLRREVLPASNHRRAATWEQVLRDLAQGAQVGSRLYPGISVGERSNPRSFNPVSRARHFAKHVMGEVNPALDRSSHSDWHYTQSVLRSRADVRGEFPELEGPLRDILKSNATESEKLKAIRAAETEYERKAIDFIRTANPAAITITRLQTHQGKTSPIGYKYDPATNELAIWNLEEGGSLMTYFKVTRGEALNYLKRRGVTWAPQSELEFFYLAAWLNQDTGY